MNNRLRGILLLFIGLGLIAIGLVAVFLLTSKSGFISALSPQPQPTAVQPLVVKSKVVAVKIDKKLGDLINPGDVSIIDVPSDLLPRDAVLRTEDAVGKYAKADLVQGELLLGHDLADPTNVNHDLAFALADDHVLMAITVADTMTKESVIQRGDIVDLFVTLSEQVDANSAPASSGGTSGTGGTSGGTTGTTGTTGTDNTTPKTTRAFTFDAFQKLGITAMVMDVIQTNQQQTPVQQAAGQVAPTPTPSRAQTTVRAYLLAMKPQDALVLKHLKDSGALFDLVLRAPTSTAAFDLTPVTQEYIVELYRLQVLK